MSDLRALSKGLQMLNQMTALILNSLLLYLVKNYTRRMGNFKVFVNISAAINVGLCFVLAIFNPATTTIQQYFALNSTFGYFAQQEIYESRYFSAVVCASFSLPFSFVVIHILYRYWTVMRPERRQWFRQAWFIVLLALYVAVDISFCYSRNILLTPSDPTATTFFVNEFFRETYNVTANEAGFIIVEYWQEGHLNILAVFFLLSVVSRFFVELIFCTVLATKTRAGIAASDSISEGHRTMQLKFVQTICAQMIIPSISVYAPLLLILLSPLVGTPSYSLSCVFPFLASCYPVWDAAAIICLIRDYREGVYTMITGKTVRNEISGYSTRGTTGAFTSNWTRTANLPRTSNPNSSSQSDSKPGTEKH
ncbi:hypothetical protein PRIPAC_74942 [Pristionchus pacificus]|uniref:G protein-coupled receptor n=1 Tax=Pristionchus pacificus TaxID=54126 RepID=A0A2A6C6H1_PRIPA|nr:hypothetical protein PRIPAC_74942 [Pristionchus pacificus]|eukprot:PDM73678.1 G protein-coupled receptor [Pristionchus pacificus]